MDKKLMKMLNIDPTNEDVKHTVQAIMLLLTAVTNDDRCSDEGANTLVAFGMSVLDSFGYITDDVMKKADALATAHELISRAKNNTTH